MGVKKNSVPEEIREGVTLKEKKIVQFAELYTQADTVNQAKLDAILATFAVFNDSNKHSNQIEG